MFNGRLFETNADLKGLFSNVRHVTTIAELRTSEVLETHVMKVMGVIDDTINNLDDMDYVIKLLQLTAHTHCQPYLHFDAKYFWVCEQFRPYVCRMRTR